MAYGTSSSESVAIASSSESFISERFSEQIYRKKEEARFRLQQEMDSILNDLFSMFTMEFDRKMAELQRQPSSSSFDTSRNGDTLSIEPRNSSEFVNQVVDHLFGEFAVNEPSRNDEKHSVESGSRYFKKSSNDNTAIETKNPENHNILSAKIESGNGDLELSSGIRHVRKKAKRKIREERSMERDSAAMLSDCSDDDGNSEKIVINVTPDIMESSDQQSTSRPLTSETAVNLAMMTMEYGDYDCGGWENEEEEDFEDETKQTTKQYVMLKVKCTEEGCDTMLRTRALLNKHLFEEHQILPNQCLVKGCKRSFRQQLGNHLRNDHIHLTKFVCSQCPRVFSRYQPLYSHISRMHTEGEFRCAVGTCQFIGRFRGEMEAHHRRAHRRKTKPTITT